MRVDVRQIGSDLRRLRKAKYGDEKEKDTDSALK
jgi:hypothetical protein